LARQVQTFRVSLSDRTDVAHVAHAARRRVQWFAYLYLLPALVIITLFHIIPVGYAIWISLQGGAVRRFTFIGLDNYARALTAPEFWSALQTTLFYVLGTVPFTMALGLGAAYLLFQKIRGRGVYRTVYFMPYVISTVASAIVWAWVFDPRSGIANRLLELVGLPPQQFLLEPNGVIRLAGEYFGVTVPGWAQGPSLALVAIMIFAVWQSLGFDMIIYLAGLSNINAELYEAARIDGANGWELFRFITIPLLAPTTFFVLIISIIGSFQAFNHIFAMNRMAAQPLGGPLGSTRTVTVFMFDLLYGQNRVGYASSVAVLLSSIILALTLFQFRFFGRRNEGE
jgi:multiple sugar transport system permease protein